MPKAALCSRAQHDLPRHRLDTDEVAMLVQVRQLELALGVVCVLGSMGMLRSLSAIAEPPRLDGVGAVDGVLFVEKVPHLLGARS